MRLRGITGSVLPVALVAAALTSVLTGVTAGPAAASPGASDPNSAPGTYRALTATRVLDTRYGVGSPRHAVAPHGTVRLALNGRGGLPAAGASAVVLNVTETQATNSGYLTAYPDGLSRPVVSNVSFPAGQTVANLVTVRLGAGGAVDLYNGTSGTVQVIADLRGYYLSGAATDPGAFTPVAPARVTDTRSSGGPVAARAVLPVPVAGREGIPGSGVSAVVLNLTATQEQSTGYLTAYGDGARPGTSNLNFIPGRTVANLVTVPLTSAGSVNIYVGSGGSVQLVVDVAGYFLSGSPAVSGAVVPVTPARVLDTRCGVAGGTCFTMTPGTYTESWPTATVVGRAGVPSSGVAAVILDVTATQANVPGFLTLTDADPVFSSSIPTTSDVNFTAGHTAANQVVFPVHGSRPVGVYFGATHEGNVAALVDVVGYVLSPGLSWAGPTAIDPQHGPSRTLSCPTASFCAGLDQYGDLRTFDGASWSDPAPIPGMTASLLSCASAQMCVAIGRAAGAQVFATYDGHAWSAALPVDPSYQLTSLSCPTTTFCMALESRGSEETFTAGSWSARVVASTANPINDLSCASATFCLFQDLNATLHVWNGSAWSDASRPPNLATALDRISCVSPTFCAAISNRTLLTYDGSVWTATSEPNNGELMSLGCASATRCAAVTSFGAATTYDGSSWQTPTVVAPVAGGSTGFGVVACGSASACVAVTTDGRSVLFNGSTWSAAVPTQPANPVSALSCPTSSFCLATDADGAAMTYDGAQWSPPTTVLATHALTHASCASATFCMVVDGSGHAVGFDGSHWTAVADPDPGVALTAVSCPTAGTCIAVDADGAALTYSGSWSAPVVVARTGLLAVSCTDTGFCLAVDGGGRPWRLNAGTWSGDDTQIGNQSVAVSCTAANQCVTTAGGYYWTLDDGLWRPAERLLSDGAGPACVDASFCLLVDDSGAVFVGAAGWAAASGPFTVSTYPTTVLASCPSDRFCLAVQPQGLASVGTA